MPNGASIAGLSRLDWPSFATPRVRRAGGVRRFLQKMLVFLLSFSLEGGAKSGVKTLNNLT